MSTSSRFHVCEPARRTANATLTGRLPATVAVAAHRLLRSSPLTASFGAAAAWSGIVEAASSRTAPTAGTETVSVPAASLDAYVPPPSSGVHADEGVAVVTCTLAVSAPLLKTSRYSRFVPGSMRLTASTPPFA